MGATLAGLAQYLMPCQAGALQRLYARQGGRAVPCRANMGRGNRDGSRGEGTGHTVQQKIARTWLLPDCAPRRGLIAL